MLATAEEAARMEAETVSGDEFADVATELGAECEPLLLGVV
jgi:hypothetical protein